MQKKICLFSISLYNNLWGLSKAKAIPVEDHERNYLNETSSGENKMVHNFLMDISSKVVIL